MKPNINFALPQTATCIVVWYRNGARHETKINTPSTSLGLAAAMLAHRVGFSEIRAVKADPNGRLKDTSGINVMGLAHQMMAC